MSMNHFQHDTNMLPSPKAINALMVKELNEMSAQEREMVYDEIHGIARVVDEEPEFVDKCLNGMELALDKIRNKPAYDIANSQNPEYAGSRDLFLMFLRSTCFNSKEAATKMVKYFECIRLYFGDDSLGRPIQYSDLGSSGIACLKNGWVQALPYRDKAGRMVVFTMFQFLNLAVVEPLDIMRCLFYTNMSILADEENQKRGYVDVITGIETLNLSPKVREFIWYIAESQDVMPLRMVANHFCIEKDSVALQLVSLANSAWGKNNRARNRIHKGTQNEWMYKLMTFGIPVEYAPITNGGQVKSKPFRDWFSSVLMLATNYPPSKKSDIHVSYAPYDKLVVIPRQTDVLSGKGSLAQQYSGNLLFYQLVEGYQSQYQGSTRTKKWEIIEEVWKLLQNENIRFLDRHESGYCWEVVVDENEIHSRIMKRLRMKKKASSPQQQSVEERNNQQIHLEEGDEEVVSFLNQSGELTCSFDCCNSSKYNGAKRRKT